MKYKLKYLNSLENYKSNKVDTKVDIALALTAAKFALNPKIINNIAKNVLLDKTGRFWSASVNKFS